MAREVGPVQTWEIEEIQRQADRHWGVVSALSRIEGAGPARPAQRWLRRRAGGVDVTPLGSRRRRLPAS